MYGLMMLVVGLLGLMIIHQTPLMGSDPTQIKALDTPHMLEQAQALAIADNLILASHELQTECVEKTVAGVWPAIQQASTANPPGPYNSTQCGGSTNFNATNIGTNALIRGSDSADLQTVFPMLSAATIPQGHIYMVRSGMYLITTWAAPYGSNATYASQICALVAAYMKQRLGGADWVGTYDANASGVQIWYGVGSINQNETNLRTSAGVMIPISPQGLFTNGCPAYVEPIHN